MPMKMKKLVAGMAAAGGGLILLTTVLFKDEIHEWLFGIRRVRTWGDLLAQKPIRLSDGVVVRLGIEDSRCPQGSGVLLYCLTEGYPGFQPNGTLEFFDGITVGPLDVSLIEEGARNEEETSSAWELFEVPIEKDASAQFLFVLAIPIPRSGTYRVMVADDGKALRHVKLEGTRQSIHPWLTLEETSPKPIDERMDVEDAYIGTFIPCAGSPAIPGWVGLIPYAQRVPRSLSDPARPLPRLLPEPGAPAEIDLKWEANWLIVTSTSPLCPDKENFAARWWVNGEPRQLSRRGTGFQNAGGSEDEVERLRFELDFGACAGDLHAGDRVSLQLMYSDQGWTKIEGNEGIFARSNEFRLLLSNRIELTVP
jgi:hypothetical protein